PASLRRSPRGAHDPDREEPGRAGMARDRGTAHRAARRRGDRRDRGTRRDRRRTRARGAPGRALRIGWRMSEGRRGMVPQDLTRSGFAPDAQLAPEGGGFAFVTRSLAGGRDKSLSTLGIAAGVGGGPRRFTAGPRRDVEPRWSPDGTRLAFLSER